MYINGAKYNFYYFYSKENKDFKENQRKVYFQSLIFLKILIFLRIKIQTCKRGGSYYLVSFVSIYSSNEFKNSKGGLII